MEMHAFGRLIPLRVATARLTAAASPILATEELALGDAVGRIGVRTVGATASIPAFPRATWDGYGFRASGSARAKPSHPVALRLIGELFAHQRRTGAVPAGGAIALATGARIPRGVDTVEIFERVRRSEGRIEIDHPVPKGRRIAQVGEDIRNGTVISRAGRPLLPATLGALAATGHSRVEVYRSPIVSIVPNGDELRLPGSPARAGTIFESNNVTLSAIVRAAGGVPRAYPPVRDDPRAIERALRAAARSSDVVLATGGSSVGEHDYLPRIFPRLGRVLFHGIAVRPGKPTLAARRGRTLFIGMPGHPTSCLSNGFWLLLPVLRRIARLPGPGWLDREVTLARDAEQLSPDLATVIPVRIEGERGYPTFHDSHAITSLAEVDAFAILPPGRRRVHRGERLTVHRLLPPLGRPL
ncbi:MAG: molybdopterin molybdotransferase MoeA [Thermoplasmata archaeon]